MRDEIRPPDWAVSGATRLNLDEFGRAFVALWRGVRSRVVKFECWQTYQEPDTRSLREYRRGNVQGVAPLLEAEADSDQVVYDDVSRRHTPFVRLRCAKRPLTRYLTFEMWNYVVRARRGETIEILDLSADTRPLPNHSFFDFLLFDESAALIHDYGTDGLQVGGWSTTAADVLARLRATGDSALKESASLVDFMRTYDIAVPPRSS